MAGFIESAPDRTGFEAALEVLEMDRNEPCAQVNAGGERDDEATRGCLHLALEDAVEDLRAGVDQGAVQSRSMGRTWMRSSAR